jgi:hypothetical protein
MTGKKRMTEKKRHALVIPAVLIVIPAVPFVILAFSLVIPAEAGIQVTGRRDWIPAYAGMTSGFPPTRE